MLEYRWSGPRTTFTWTQARYWSTGTVALTWTKLSSLIRNRVCCVKLPFDSGGFSYWCLFVVCEHLCESRPTQPQAFQQTLLNCIGSYLELISDVILFKTSINTGFHLSNEEVKQEHQSMGLVGPGWISNHIYTNISFTYKGFSEWGHNGLVCVDHDI